MRIAHAILAAWLMLLAALAPARAHKRVALVIGNGAYEHLNALKNPPNDARDLAEALGKLDFEVDLGVDLTLTRMQEKVKAFARRARAADVALAFFAGHGTQAADPRGSASAMNYLLPIDADIKDAEDLRFLLTARDILEPLQAAGSIRILILDACRDNAIPLRLAKGRSVSVARGLTREPRTNGTLIAYSTQPDTVAGDGTERNSPFVKALLDHIAEPGLDIRLLFTDVRGDVIRRTGGAQTPETSDSLNGRFAFNQASDHQQAAPFSSQQAAVVAPAGPVAVPAAQQAPPSADAPQPGPVAFGETSAPAAPASPSGPTLRSPFRDCSDCPEMVVIEPGTVRMQLVPPNSSEPRELVAAVPQPFAVGRYELTRGEFRAFAEATGFTPPPGCYVRTPGWRLDANLSWHDPGYPQDDRHPVACISFDDAKAYVAWLSRRTGRSYRLLTDAEWHFVASTPDVPQKRGAGQCRFANGADRTTRDAEPAWSIADCSDGYHYTAPVGSFVTTGPGLSDLFGNLWEWVDSCAPDFSRPTPAFVACGSDAPRILRGGSWSDRPEMLALDARLLSPPQVRDQIVGVRIAREISPCEAKACPSEEAFQSSHDRAHKFSVTAPVSARSATPQPSRPTNQSFPPPPER